MTQHNFEPARFAHESEEDEIVRLFMMLEPETAVLPYDPVMVRAALREAFNRQNGIVGVIAGSGGIEAATFLQIRRPWYSSAHCLQQMQAGVHPEHRRSAHGKKLVLFAKHCADRLGLPLLADLVINGDTERKAERLRREMSSVAEVYVYRGQPAEGVPA